MFLKIVQMTKTFSLIIFIFISFNIFARDSRSAWHNRDIRHFEKHDRAVWHGGVWRHGRYGGRLGWWWIVGPTWYYYPRPIYPAPDPYIPPVTTIQSPAPQVQNWYYCEASKEYYPYTSSCPGGWKTIPANPPK